MASVYTRIMAGELPGHFVWRDATCIAIMTIAPISPGHVLVIPREEIDHWDDLPADVAMHLMGACQPIARAIKAAFNPRRVGMIIAGMEVPHAHLHLLPLNSMSDFDFGRVKTADAQALAAVAATLREKLLAAGYSQAQC